MSVRWLTIWMLAAALALAMNIGSYPLLDADEGRNAEVGREMAATNDYVVPHLDGLPYLDKPIVYFAAEAAAMEVLGPTELAARLPAYLFTLATAALLFWFARSLWGIEEAAVAVIAFLSMPLTIAFARTVIFDSALTFFIVLATIAFYFAVEERAGKRDSEFGIRDSADPGSASRIPHPESRKWPILAWAAMGFGVLTKGPVAIALPLFVAIPYAIWRRSFRALWSIIGVIVFAAIIAPWLWGMENAIPGFLRYALVTETAQRLATKALKRTGPPWYFVPYLLAGALPWSVVLLTSWRGWWAGIRDSGFGIRRTKGERSISSAESRVPNPESRATAESRIPNPESGATAESRIPNPESRSTTLFLTLWLAIPFIFFSLSQSKRPQYIVPLMAPLALLVAQKLRTVKVRPAAIVAVIIGAILIAAPFFPQFTKGMKPVLVAPARVSAMALGVMFVICGLAAAFLPEPRDIALIALSAPLLALPLLSNPIMDAVADRRSTKKMVTELSAHISPQTQVIGIEAFTGSMAFYLRRPIIVASDNAEEFTSNYLIRHYQQFSTKPDSPLRPVSWVARNLEQCCQERVYVVRKVDRDNCRLLESRGMRILAEGERNLAYGVWRGPNTMQGGGVDAAR